MSGGAIPDNADYDVVLEPSGHRVGSINEDFAIESLPGDIFQLGNTSWKILKIETGRVRVADAAGQPPNIPFWFGEAPARSDELSAAVSRLRRGLWDAMGRGEPLDLPGGVAFLETELRLPTLAAEQLAGYLASGAMALGAMPTGDTLVLERFFDEVGDMHMVVHSPLGSRLNRAWGLALRKRFCQQFDFELQAAATEDAIILSLGPTHSFALDEAFRFLSSNSVREVLTQALLDAPLFTARWRWNANRALAVLRNRSSGRVPAQIQRMNAEDLLAVVFPDQLACLENVVGRREIPDHPLVNETLRDCLTEAMDVEGLEGLLESIEAGERTLIARDLREPSPLATEILTANPYAYLDDAPAEERRTQAVYARRWIDPQTAADIGALDRAAIERTRNEAWPNVRDADELHDALVVGGVITEDEGVREGWASLFDELAEDGRATRLELAGGHRIWGAAERLPELGAVYPDARLSPPIDAPADRSTRVGARCRPWSSWSGADWSAAAR